MAVIGLYSAKGGVGKTASAVNFAWLSAHGGARSVLWDLDPQAAASFYLRVPAELQGGVEGLLGGRTPLADALRHSSASGLDVLPGHFSYRHFERLLADPAAAGALGHIIGGLCQRYEMVFLDLPPGIGTLAERAFDVVDLLLVPAIPTPLSLRTVAQLIAHLGRRERRPRHLSFLTMVDRRKALHRQISDWVATQKLAFLATPIPYASEIEKMGIQPNPVFAFAASSPAALAYAELWREIEAARRASP